MSDEAPAEIAHLRPAPDWRFYDYDSVQGIVQWALPLDDRQLIICTQHVNTGPLLDFNAEREAASQGVPFGDGKIVASVPLNVAYQSGLMQAVREKDKRFFSRFMNDPDNRRFRSFRGRV